MWDDDLNESKNKIKIGSLLLLLFVHPTGKKNCWHTEEKKMRTLAGVEDEEKWLAEGIAGIQHNAFFMHRALVRSCSYIPPTELSPFWSDEFFIFVSQDANNLREVLKYSALMLSELRTSKLSPQKYYDLCRFHRHNFESLDFLLVFDRFFYGFSSFWFGYFRYASFRSIEAAGDFLQGWEQAWITGGGFVWACSTCRQHIAQDVSWWFRFSFIIVS